ISPLFILTPDQTNNLVLSLNNTNASVVLDGSGSSDVENDPLTYSWLEETNQVATGILATNSFALGAHSVTLRVSDGKDTGTAEIEFEVITASESIDLLIAGLGNSSLSSKSQQPLTASLKSASASCDRGNLTSATSQLRAFQNKVTSQV